MLLAFQKNKDQVNKSPKSEDMLGQKIAISSNYLRIIKLWSIVVASSSVLCSVSGIGSAKQSGSSWNNY